MSDEQKGRRYGIPASHLSGSSPSQAAALTLDEATVEAIARRVVELLGSEPSKPDGLVDAATLAERLGTTRSFVYEHSDELGARRLGGGPKARLRFDPVEAEAAYSCVAVRESREEVAPASEPIRRRRRKSGMGSEAPLLPIRGRERLDDAA